ncbi:hypothetical protein [Ancylobacter sp. FA202]|uniref:hypothetical protein n=1 Tax=Ancylobacter sp. FA202 TaxID=1111106 RepID=UPI0012DFD2D5|nr:hypothetical protein [Ancylobacter sp. FA202]
MRIINCLSGVLLIVMLATFLLIWPSILTTITREDFMSDSNAAWVQAIAAAITIMGATGYAVFGMIKASFADNRERHLTFRIACDVFSDSAKYLYDIHDLGNHRSESLKAPSLIFQANAEILQQMAFRPLPDGDHANLVFELRTCSYRMLSGIIALQAHPSSAPPLAQISDALKEAKKLIAGPLFIKSEQRTPKIKIA